jgi:hypothetical protein
LTKAAKALPNELPSVIAPPCFPRAISQSQISPSETAEIVLPCLPSSAAPCDGRHPRQLEHFVGGELHSARPRQEKRGGAHLDGLGRLKRIELQIELSRDSSQTDFVIET